MTRLRSFTGLNNFVTGQAANYSALPTASEHNSEVWIAIAAEGLWLINRKEAGLYYSNGTTWVRLGQIPSFFDTTNFKLNDGSDITKLMNVDLSGMPTSTTKTLTVTGSLNIEADSNINQDLTTDSEPTFSDINITGLSGNIISTGNVETSIEELDSRLYNDEQITKDPTGFVDPEDVIITGDSSTRKVTLTGTVEAYSKGVRVSVLTSGWVSDAHGSDTEKIYFLN